MTDTFSADQIEEWKDYWELFDTEGQGNIYWSVVGAAIRSFGWAPTNQQWHEVIFKLYGADQTDVPELEQRAIPSKEELNSKQITFDDFLPVLAEVSTLPSTGTKEDFIEGMKVFDKDSNGYVLAVEIQHVLGSLGESLSQEEVTAIFKGVETNSAGMMKYDEFVKHIMADPADD